jgi:hypothetical protein
MTQLRSQSKAYYALTEVEEAFIDGRGSMTITFDQSGVAEDLGGNPPPPITDCLVLDEYLGEQITAIKDRLDGIGSYVWHSEANYEDAEKCCLAAIAANREGDQDATEVFANATEDLFHFDRALRVSVVHETSKPLHRNEIPKRLMKLEGSRGTEYQLKVSKFKWSSAMPRDAVRKAAEVKIANPPDAFWIAEYERSSSTYDPILYASYGLWQVELGRWE